MRVSRSRSLLVATAACLAALFLVPAGAGAAQPGVVLPNPGGADVHSKVIASGAKHVRVFASWKMLEQHQGEITPYIVSGYEDLVNRMRGAGIGVYLVVTETPSWAGSAGNSPPPHAAFADFMHRLAARFRGRVMGYEAWNEPNGPTFWQGSAPPATYTALLKSTYAAVKSADPAAKVGIGGLVGNDYNYVDALYKAGAKGHFDFVGIHTDNACSRTDPREAARDADGRISRWSFTGYREVRSTMLDHGDDKPIWMTELGWSVTTVKCPTNTKEPAGVTRDQQALYLSNAYGCLAADPYVPMASWFSLQDFGPTEGIGYRYGLFDYSGAARPAFAAFKSAGGASPDSACGLPVDRGAAPITIVAPTNNKNVSGDLNYEISASDPQGIRTLTLYVDGRRVRITGKSAMKGIWYGWRKLNYGPHKLAVKAVDTALNVSMSEVTVNRVHYGAGEDVGTRIGAGVYGRSKTRTVVGRLYTKPAVARLSVRGRLQITFERKAGSRWVPMGRASGGNIRKHVKLSRRFKPGKYRVILTFPGYKSFRPSATRRSFRVK
jgi:Cellulase (glycosyl hydrolase family 5)